MITFKELGLKEEILKAIEELGFEFPMPIQEKVIPFMENSTSDLVALAQTGTGKTAGFGLPILQKIDTSLQKTQALVLAPTRELCVQISNDLKNFSKYMRGLKVVPVYGGEDIVKQLRQLDTPPQILVATPGRLIDLIERRKVNLSTINFLVLDEADEMLNMGFKEAIETILEKTPETRQTLLFSATMPKEIANIARKYMKDYEEIAVGKRNAGAENVEHIYYVVQARQRYLALKRVVDLNPDMYGIVFCRTRQETKEVAEHLMKDGYSADALHGDLSQAQRDSVMQKFRIKNIQLLVATDVAARGLDVSDLTHVINYNLPDDIESYTHRSGRTGRANKSGISVSIIHSKERFKIKDIERMINKKFEQQQIPNGLEVCKKQLFFLVDKLENVTINDEQIDPFMPAIYKKLESMEKEELIKRFVSTEFNRFLDYYKNAVDLNLEDTRGERRGGKKDRTRFKINLGSNEGCNPKQVLGMINDLTQDKSINVGDIEVTNKYCFFDIDSDQADRVVDAFKQQNEIVLNLVTNDKPRANSQRNDGGDRGRSYKSNDRSGGFNRGGESRRDGDKNRSYGGGENRRNSGSYGGNNRASSNNNAENGGRWRKSSASGESSPRRRNR
jgi:ATP-dependent RNA helicase DeaD